MREEVLHMKDLLKGNSKGLAESKAVDATEDVDDFVVDAVGAAPVEASTIPINYMDVEQIVITEITDSKGRLSDIIESFEIKTGLSVIPLDMADIAPEVTQFSRHNIFTIGEKRWAMSNVIRQEVVDAYIAKIVESLKTGLPFTESLSVIIPYNGVDYKSFALSQKEWTYILSAFNLYVGNLYVRGDDLILEVTPKRRK